MKQPISNKNITLCYNDVLFTQTMPFRYEDKCFIKILKQKNGQLNVFVQNIISRNGKQSLKKIYKAGSVE